MTIVWASLIRCMLDLKIKFPIWVINSDNIWEQDGIIFIDDKSKSKSLIRISPDCFNCKLKHVSKTSDEVIPL